MGCRIILFKKKISSKSVQLLNNLAYVGLFISLVNLVTSCDEKRTGTNQKEATTTALKKRVGEGCDGCELMYIGMPVTIRSVDTSAGWVEKGQKLLVTGSVFKPDGKTPAKDVVIYYWQTDNKGYYSPATHMDERVKKHGHIRGWIKTDDKGKYSLYTLRPAPYPNDVLPAHIHLSIKEPDLENEYYTDEINFDDDTLLPSHFKKYPQENRGGSGVVRIFLKGDIQIAEHDIILGLNIPNYPKKASE